MGHVHYWGALIGDQNAERCLDGSSGIEAGDHGGAEGHAKDGGEGCMADAQVTLTVKHLHQQLAATHVDECLPPSPQAAAELGSNEVEGLHQGGRGDTARLREPRNQPVQGHVHQDHSAIGDVRGVNEEENQTK